MDWNHETLREAAEPIGNGWSRARIYLRDGDSAPYPGSTKRALRGTGEIVYDLPPEGGLDVREVGANIWTSWLMPDDYRDGVTP